MSQTKRNKPEQTGSALRQAFTTVRTVRAAAREMRKPDIVVVCGLLAAMAVIMLIGVAWVPTDSLSYFQSRSGIFSLDSVDYNLQATTAVAADCPAGIDCRPVLLQESELRPITVADLDTHVNTTSQDQHLLLVYEFNSTRVRHLGTEPTFVVSLPGFAYDSAAIYMGDTHLRSFRQGERLFVSLDAAVLAADTFALEVMLTFKPSVRPISVQRDFVSPMVATQSEFNRYQNFLGSRQFSGAGKMGHLAKIVLALFCLMLFLIVDSSPESLGLALFMGFEAVAMGIGEGWFPLGWLGIENKQVVSHFCYQMGDIMKLYFLLQIARVGGVSAAPWLIIGTILSVPYGFFMQYASDHSISWTFMIPRTRDTISGGLGALCCLYTLWKIRGMKLPWRYLALTVAAVAGAGEVANSWLIHSDLARVNPGLKTFFTVFQANIGYLFALSTFFNISTLENRVKVLTAEKENAAELKRQLELSHTVQKSFLALPVIPDEIRISWFHEAATYVSGDTYFVHWDEARAVLTVLLNDVTGHGIQAGLKAFSSNIIAKTLWCESQQFDFRRKGDRRRQRSRLEKFDELVERLLCSQETPPDFNAMIGLELDLNTRKISVYRVNYNFPLLIQPETDPEWSKMPTEPVRWKVSNLAFPSRTLTEFDFKPGSMLVLISDGLIDSPRDRAGLVKYLAGQLNVHAEIPAAGTVKNTALSWIQENCTKAVDDKTMVVIQWDPHLAVQENPTGNSDKAS